MTGRREELLIDRALSGLTEDERRELAERIDDASFDIAASALELSTMNELEPMPESLRAKIERDARAFFDRPGARVVRVGPDPTKPVPWIVAAACFALAVAGWAVAARRPAPSADLAPPAASIVVAATPSAAPCPTASPAEPIDRVAAAPDVVRRAWSATKDEAARGASGEVVWSDAEQRGYMRIRGLAKNDAARVQYQLWIFDMDRDDRYPVDGGVFDVAGEDVVVPIDAKVHVGRATLFAITVEKPGGVVVSKRERIVLAAKI